jgi:diguanylate cyclase (GGDEF)-like protein
MRRKKESGKQINSGSIHPAYRPYLYGVIWAGLLIVAFSIFMLLQSDIGPQWLILAFITILTSSYSIRIPGINSKISIGDTLFFTNLLLFGIPAGVITAALDGFAGSVRSQTTNRRIQYTLFNSATMALSAFIAGTIFLKLSPTGLLSKGFNAGIIDLLIPLGVLAFAHYMMNSGSVAIIVALEKRKNIFHIWKDNFLWTSITYFAGVAAASFIAITVGDVTPQVLGVAVPVLLAVYFTYKTYLKKVEEVRSMAYFDSLTGLPNRTFFKEQLEDALVLSQGKNQKLALMFLDVDHFKRINDTYGHGVGDLLLRNVASRLAASVRGSNSERPQESKNQNIVIGRFGGDEFTIFVNAIERNEDALRIARRFLQALSAPYSLDGHEVNAAATIGISIYPLDGADADTLLKNADAALYHAKEYGRNNCHIYSQSISEKAAEKLSIENQLRKALKLNELEIHYQPRIRIDNREISGLEALIRWKHPNKGLLSAYEFVEIAEESGLIIPIGEWVIRTVCSHVATWVRNGLDVVPVAINLSPLQFRQANLSEMIARILGETPLDPALIELELTENAIMENEQSIVGSISELRSLGVKISIDDFGVGYSSLSRLKRFRLDALKIDKSFVTDCARNADDRSIISAIIAVAKSLGFNVVAEGVETEEQLSVLNEMGCNEIQGFYFFKAFTFDEISGILSGSDGSLSTRLKDRRAQLRLISSKTPAAMNG